MIVPQIQFLRFSPVIIFVIIGDHNQHFEGRKGDHFSDQVNDQACNVHLITYIYYR